MKWILVAYRIQVLKSILWANITMANTLQLLFILRKLIHDPLIKIDKKLNMLTVYESHNMLIRYAMDVSQHIQYGWMLIRHTFDCVNITAYILEICKYMITFIHHNKSIHILFACGSWNMKILLTFRSFGLIFYHIAESI